MKWGFKPILSPITDSQNFPCLCAAQQIVQERNHARGTQRGPSYVVKIGIINH